MREKKFFFFPFRLTKATAIQLKRQLYRRRTIPVFLAILIIFAQLTNPFFRWSIVKDSFSVSTDALGNLKLAESGNLSVRTQWPFRDLAMMKNTTHIVTNVYVGSPKTKSEDLEGIIDEIHALRFNQRYPYIISGDHFSVFYPRSLGIFYATTLDPRTARGEEDWYNRQAMYLKSTAFALDVFSHTDKLATTIVPLAPRTVTTVNIYSLTSDTLYSLLYALDVMHDPTTIATLYPASSSAKVALHTQTQADELLAQYKDTLRRHLITYIDSIRDPETGLVKKDILLSGTKDIAKRQSAFYDNVIYWKTLALAQKLGIIPEDAKMLAELKANILSNFWDAQGGFFREDLSNEAIQHGYYSSDWLIALMTGFLSPTDKNERFYFEQSFAYIQQHQLDVPLGLKYQEEDRAHREYAAVRFFAPSYGGTAIWSHWGMEYIKGLTLLARETGESSYLQKAKAQLKAYEERMIKYRGYPELYESNGEMFSNFLYTSVRRTGWVVNYEQARILVADVEQEMKTASSN